MLWDIPEYSGAEEANEENTLRPDGKIVLKEEQRVLLLDMTVPWIENRETKLVEKVDKYKNIIRN